VWQGKVTICWCDIKDKNEYEIVVVRCAKVGFERSRVGHRHHRQTAIDSEHIYEEVVERVLPQEKRRVI